MPLDGVISLYRPWTRAAEERIFRAQVTNKMPLGPPAASQDSVADKSVFLANELDFSWHSVLQSSLERAQGEHDVAPGLAGTEFSQRSLNFTASQISLT